MSEDTIKILECKLESAYTEISRLESIVKQLEYKLKSKDEDLTRRSNEKDEVIHKLTIMLHRQLNEYEQLLIENNELD